MEIVLYPQATESAGSPEAICFSIRRPVIGLRRRWPVLSGSWLERKPSAVA